MAKKYKITQDHESCIGCGMCVSLCGENWEMGEDGKAHPIKKEIGEEELSCNKKAEENCPVGVIKIKEE